MSVGTGFQTCSVSIVPLLVRISYESHRASIAWGTGKARWAGADTGRRWEGLLRNALLHAIAASLMEEPHVSPGVPVVMIEIHGLFSSALRHALALLLR